MTNGNALTKTFTVRNTGTTTLNLGTVTTSGGNLSDFTLDILGMSPTVVPGGNTAFRVRFTPGASGTRSTTLTISSDDSDESPFVLNLTGNGVTPVCTPPPANMAAWYTAENSAIDVIGGNSGTLSGGVTFVPGKVDQAFSFDGIDDLVTVPDNPSLQMTNAVSVDFWANGNATESISLLKKVVIGRMELRTMASDFTTVHLDLPFISIGQAVGRVCLLRQTDNGITMP